MSLLLKISISILQVIGNDPLQYDSNILQNIMHLV